MIEKPTVSVLIFAYNHENYIKETINSVVCQKCSFSFEILVSDDFSTDNTLNIIKKLKSKYPELIKIISNKHNLGLNKSFVNAVKNAKGEYIAILGGDDLWIVENKLEMQVQLLLSHKEISYVHTEFKMYNESHKKIINHCNKNWYSILMRETGKDALFAMLCHNWTGYPLASSSCFRKEPLLKGINNHPEILNFNLDGEGTITHISMIYYGGLYTFIPVQTTMYRVRKNSLSHRSSKTKQFNYQKQYYLLRLFIAETFDLDKNEIRKIQKKGLLELFRTAIALDTKDEFRAFQKTQEIRICCCFLSYLHKFKLLRYIYKWNRKFTYSLKKYNAYYCLSSNISRKGI